MKRIERRHLKKNELADTILAVREFVARWQRQIAAAGVALALIVVALTGVSVVRQRTERRAAQVLAEAMVALNAQVVPAGQPGAEGLPAAATLGATGTFATEEAKLNAALPKLTAAADAYPGTAAGITARYHLAGALAALGRHDEAIDAYTQVIDRAGRRSLYGRMATLGKADAQAQAGQLDAAIATWRELVAENAGDLPVDAILMELARAYLQQGNTDEARRALTQLVEEHPDSLYSVEARSRLERMPS